MHKVCSGEDGVAVSFNGGKDCTVLLHLLTSLYPNKVWPVCHVIHQDSFPEIEDFVEDCNRHYKIILSAYTCDIKMAFQNYINENPRIKAVFVGVRRSDPKCQTLSSMQITDNGWPVFYRIHPLLNWTYMDIWSYLINKKVTYCSLYDKGYTSIGDMKSTMPNPMLKTTDGKFEPAFKLENQQYERLGRQL